MEYTIEAEGKINIIKMTGNIFNEQQTQDLQSDVNERVDNGEKLYILDMTEMKFINSTGLSLLLTLMTKSRKAGGELVLLNVSEQLNKLLMITKLLAVFQIMDDKEKANELLNNLD